MGRKRSNPKAKNEALQPKVDATLSSETPETLGPFRQLSGTYTCRLCPAPNKTFTQRRFAVAHLQRVHDALAVSSSSSAAQEPEDQPQAEQAHQTHQITSTSANDTQVMLEELRRTNALLLELINKQNPPPAAAPLPSSPTPTLPPVRTSPSPSPDPEFTPPTQSSSLPSPHVQVSPASRQRLGRECSPVVLPDGSEWVLNSDMMCALRSVCGLKPNEAKDTLRPLSNKGKKVKKDSDPRLFRLLKNYRESRNLRHQSEYVLVKASEARSFCDCYPKLSKEKRAELRKHIFGSPE